SGPPPHRMPDLAAPAGYSPEPDLSRRHPRDEELARRFHEERARGDESSPGAPIGADILRDDGDVDPPGSGRGSVEPEPTYPGSESAYGEPGPSSRDQEPAYRDPAPSRGQPGPMHAETRRGTP